MEVSGGGAGAPGAPHKPREPRCLWGLLVLRGPPKPPGPPKLEGPPGPPEVRGGRSPHPPGALGPRSPEDRRCHSVEDVSHPSSAPFWLKAIFGLSHFGSSQPLWLRPFWDSKPCWLRPLRDSSHLWATIAIFRLRWLKPLWLAAKDISEARASKKSDATLQGEGGVWAVASRCCGLANYFVA